MVHACFYQGCLDEHGCGSGRSWRHLVNLLLSIRGPTFSRLSLSHSQPNSQQPQAFWFCSVLVLFCTTTLTLHDTHIHTYTTDIIDFHTPYFCQSFCSFCYNKYFSLFTIRPFIYISWPRSRVMTYWGLSGRFSRSVCTFWVRFESLLFWVFFGILYLVVRFVLFVCRFGSVKNEAICIAHGLYGRDCEFCLCSRL